VKAAGAVGRSAELAVEATVNEHFSNGTFFNGESCLKK
jgi:hypothetical protein